MSATLDSPDQGATGLPIDSISVTGKSLRFEMKSLGANYEGVISADGSQLEGQFSQQGLRLPLTFKRIVKDDSTLLTATEDESMSAEGRRVWIDKHKEWMATVPGSKHIVVEKASHFIQAQQPALVIEAIKQVSKQPR